MLDIDLIIPCYGKSELINRGLASLATQWKREFIHVTLVNDCSPNTDCNYQDLVNRYKDVLDIRCIQTPENYGQGLTRQYGIDNTSRDWFMFMDEDDQYCPLAISQIVGCAELYGKKQNKDGSYPLDETGNLIPLDDVPKLALVSAPLFEFDDNHTHVIESANQVWLNAKLYNRSFLELHNVRFNKAQSRHAEDYFFTSCLFYALDHDKDYVEVLLDNEGLYYLWYPNELSQSRVDPDYGFMLSGYTMDGSVNFIKYMESDESKIEQSDDVRKEIINRTLNMCIYSYYTFLAFLHHVATTDYVPKLELDWTLLRDACNKLREKVKEHWDEYSYMQKLEELYRVKNMSDVQYAEPWIDFDSYIMKPMQEFEWDFEKLIKCKETYKIDENGNHVYGDYNVL